MSIFKRTTPATEAAEKALEAELAQAVANDFDARPKTFEDRLAERDAAVEATLQQLDRQHKIEMVQIQKLEAEAQARRMRVVVQIDKRIAAAKAYQRELESRP